MGVERFDVLLRDSTTGGTIKREWSKAELVRSVAWLKRMNARGHNILVRPSGEHGLALIHSLTAENLARMRGKGLSPALSVEVSGNEFQVWVKLSDRPMPETVRRLAEAGLRSTFGRTADKVVRGGYGRLAGFTDHEGHLDCLKRERYILAHMGRLEIGKQASAYVEHVIQTLQELKKAQEHPAQVQRIANPGRPDDRGR